MFTVLTKEINRKGVNFSVYSFLQWFHGRVNLYKSFQKYLKNVFLNVNNEAFSSLAFITLLSDLGENLFAFFMPGFSIEMQP